jgi:hypothetical protein
VLQNIGAYVMSSARKIGEYFQEGIRRLRSLFARPAGAAALEGTGVEPPPNAAVVPQSAAQTAEPAQTSGVWQDGKLVPGEVSFSPGISEQALSRASGGDEVRVDDRAEQFRVLLLAMKAREVRLRRERDDPAAPSDDDLLAYFLQKTDKDWGWSDTQINAAFDTFSRILYPDAVVPPITPAGAEGRVVPIAASAVIGAAALEGETSEERSLKTHPWLLAAVGGVAVGAAAWLGLQALLSDHPRPPAAATSPSVSPSGSQSTSGPGGKNDEGTPPQDRTPEVQTRLEGAKADDKGDFVRMSAYADRHTARQNGRDFSTVWWIAREQLDAVDGPMTPTNRQIWEFTDQTLDHNGLTWDEARRLRAEQKIRLLSDTAARQVIETLK